MSKPLGYYAYQTARPRGLAIVFAVTAGIASLLSLVLIGIGAGEEPYFGAIRISEGLLQVGGAGMLFAFWIGWTCASAAYIWKRRLHPVWTAAIIWAVIVMVYLAENAVGYMQDLRTAQMTAVPGGPSTRSAVR